MRRTNQIVPSAALPGIYPPVAIRGHYYVDGVLLKTMHASVALEHGASLDYADVPEGEEIRLVVWGRD